MQAVINTVRGFLPHLRSRVVCLMCDNAVTVAYIKNQGGTRSYTLMQLTICLLKWCDHKAIMLVPVHLPGVRNVEAVALSRIGQTLITEGSLAMEHLRPYDQRLSSGVIHRSTCLLHSPTDAWSSLYRHILLGGGCRNTSLPTLKSIHVWRLCGPS